MKEYGCYLIQFTAHSITYQIKEPNSIPIPSTQLNLPYQNNIPLHPLDVSSLILITLSVILDPNCTYLNSTLP